MSAKIIAGNIDARHEKIHEQLKTAIFMSEINWRNYTTALRLGLIPAGRFPDEPRPGGASAA